jgi:hypothetical protein
MAGLGACGSRFDSVGPEFRACTANSKGMQLIFASCACLQFRAMGDMHPCPCVMGHVCTPVPKDSFLSTARLRLHLCDPCNGVFKCRTLWPGSGKTAVLKLPCTTPVVGGRRRSYGVLVLR